MVHGLEIIKRMNEEASRVTLVNAATYLSSVLTCDTGCDECKVCRFLSGDRSLPVLFEVIKILDRKLFETERAEKAWIRLYTKLLEQLNYDDDALC